ncbi:MAG: hypothetical protein U0838_13525 [Chloroflexota bacterium]
MGRLYVASVLIAMSSKRRTAAPAEELKPITPGAWAAWAKSWDSKSEAPAAQPVAAHLHPAGSKA